MNVLNTDPEQNMLRAHTAGQGNTQGKEILNSNNLTANVKARHIFAFKFYHLYVFPSGRKILRQRNFIFTLIFSV